MEPKVLGTLLAMNPKFVGHFREDNLITQEGEYEEDYLLEAPDPNERVCYYNNERGLSWMWMYDVLITKVGV